MDKKILDKNKEKEKFLTYKIHFSGVDVENLENQIFKTNDDYQKISIELRRISRLIHTNTELFSEYSYKFYEIYNKYKNSGKTLTAQEIDQLKYKIVQLDILCGLKVGLVSVFSEDKDLDNINYVDSETHSKKNIIR